LPSDNAADDLQRLLALARDAAWRASEAIMKVYATGFDVRRKDDASPVTLADEQAEHIILAVLAAGAPTIPAISEEHAAAHGLPDRCADLVWLVDPLDGTKEFVSRNGEFTVNIGLVHNGEPILGIVYLPAQEVTYAGVGIGSATRQHGTAPPQKIAARLPPADGLTIVSSRSHESNDAFAAYVAGLKIGGMKVAGSALKFGLLAAGEADLYPRFGPTMEWDTAAGHAVLNAAGGSMTMHDGTPFRYGKPGFVNPGFIARGRV
jgi:3'(2'), 5'-bisphosphate nucleotidase